MVKLSLVEKNLSSNICNEDTMWSKMEQRSTLENKKM